MDDKTTQLLSAQTQNEEDMKGFAESEQNLRTEVLTQGRLIDILKEKLEVTSEQNQDLKANLKSTRTEMEQLLDESIQLKVKVS